MHWLVQTILIGKVVGKGEWVELGYPWIGIKYSLLLWYLVPDSVAMPSLVICTL